MQAFWGWGAGSTGCSMHELSKVMTLNPLKRGKNNLKAHKERALGQLHPTLSHIRARMLLKYVNSGKGLSRTLWYLSHTFGHEHLNDIFLKHTLVFPGMGTLEFHKAALRCFKKTAPGSPVWQARVNSHSRTLPGCPHSRNCVSGGTNQPQRPLPAVKGQG